MIFPGEEGLVIVLVCICILLVSFSIISFGRIVDKEISTKLLILRADAIADSVVKGTFRWDAQNAQVRIDKEYFGQEYLGGDSIVVRRVFFDKGLKSIEVRVW